MQRENLSFMHTCQTNVQCFLRAMIGWVRPGSLMVSALDSTSGGPGLSPGQGTALCSWERHFTLTVLLFTQVYKWVMANLPLVDNPAMDQHPIQGGVEILLVASCHRNRDKFWPDGPLGSNPDFTMIGYSNSVYPLLFSLEQSNLAKVLFYFIIWQKQTELFVGPLCALLSIPILMNWD